MTTVHKSTQEVPSGPSSIASDKPVRKKRHVVTFLFIVLMFITLGSSGFLLYQGMQFHQETAKQLRGALMKMNAMNLRQEKTDATLLIAEKRVDDASALLSSLDNQLQSALQNQLHQSKDWTLLKARYYLELAQINAYWSDNPDVTVALLHQADLLLTTVHEPQLFDIRGAIAEESSQAERVVKLDKIGLLTQLDAAEELCNQLIVKQVSVDLDKNSSKTISGTLDAKSSSMWREGLKNSLSMLEKLVIVTRDDRDIHSIVTPAYAGLLREEIRLLLQETQLAVLQGNERVYELTLKQALKKVSQSFSLDNANTQALLSQLQALEKIQFSLKKPVMGRALSLLNKLIDSKQTTSPAKLSSENGVSTGDN